MQKALFYLELITKQWLTSNWSEVRNRCH